MLCGWMKQFFSLQLQFYHFLGYGFFLFLSVRNQWTIFPENDIIFLKPAQAHSIPKS